MPSCCASRGAGSQHQQLHTPANSNGREIIISGPGRSSVNSAQLITVEVQLALRMSSLFQHASRPGCGAQNLSSSQHFRCSVGSGRTHCVARTACVSTRILQLCYNCIILELRTRVAITCTKFINLVLFHIRMHVLYLWVRKNNILNNYFHALTILIDQQFHTDF